MQVYRRATELLEAEVGSDVVALDPEAGLCFGFNEVAAAIWRHLEKPRSFVELKDHLLAIYDVDEDECVSELANALNEMQLRKLIMHETAG